MTTETVRTALVLLCLITGGFSQFDLNFQSHLRSGFRDFFRLGEAPLQSPANDTGYVKSCSPGVNFNVSWTPKDIDPQKQIMVFFYYVIPHNFSRGLADVKLYFNNISSPIFEDSFGLDCSEISKYLRCPLMKGMVIGPTHMPYKKLLILKGYDGTYKAQLQLTNDKGQVMFCAKVKVTIKT